MFGGVSVDFCLVSMPIGQLTFAQQDIGGVCNVEAKDDRRNYTATTTTATTTTTTTTTAVLSSGYPAVMPQLLGPLCTSMKL